MRFSIALAAMLTVCLTPVAVDVRISSMAVTPASLAPGDIAPTFTLKGSDGKTYRLADFRGKRAVVLAWFAKPFSGG